jgi:hypothetical protein
LFFDISVPSPATSLLFSPGFAGSTSPVTVNPSLPGVAGICFISNTPGSTLAKKDLLLLVMYFLQNREKTAN